MQKKITGLKVRRPKSEPVAPQSRSLHPPLPAIYALRTWSVKKVNGKWFVSQAARFDDKGQWMGPYDTIHRATAAIARKLAEEVMERHQARCP
jgi:hypothetical protein